MTIGIHATVSALWLVKKIAKTGLFLSITLYCFGVSVSTAVELVPISTPLKNPSAYQLKVVSVHGTVYEVIRYEPPLGPKGPDLPEEGCVFYGAYTFTLVDDTAAILVSVNGTCIPGRVRPVAEGTRVAVTGQMQLLADGTAQIYALKPPDPE